MTTVIQDPAWFEAERRVRMDRLWERLAAALGGEPCPKPTTLVGIARRVRMYLARGAIPNWTWESALEYAEVANQKGQPLPFLLELAEPEPTPAMAGSAAKVAVLASRAANGLELFHNGDGPGVMVQVEKEV